MTSTTLSPERYYAHHHHHHQVRPPIGPIPAFPESPARPTTTTRPTTLKPTTQGQGHGASGGQGLGLPAILFISIGSAVILLVFLVCIYMTWRHSRARKLPTWKQESLVGRAIQRRSFFPRFSRYRNQPIVLNYPDPDSHLPNYSIQTPYTFSSSSTLASTPGSFGVLESRNNNSIPDVPSYRATIY